MKPSFKIGPEPRMTIAPLAVQAQTLFREGLRLQNLGQLEQAHAIYLQVLKLQPGHFDALHMLGVVAARTNNPARAIELINTAIAVNPNSASAYSNRGNALGALKQYQAAVASYDQAIAIKPDHVNAYFNRGKALYELKQYQDAIASFDQAIAIKPDHADAYCDRGVAMSDLKQYQAAIASYDKAIAIQPNHAKAYCNCGVAWYELKQHRIAIDCYEKAVNIAPSYADAYFNRGVVLNELKQYKAAIESYDIAVAIEPDNAVAYAYCGIALREFYQHQAAIDSFDKAIALKPDYADAYFNRIAPLISLKQYEDAIASYNKAIAIRPDSGFIFGQLINTKMQICDWSDADNQITELVRKIQLAEKATTPFPFLALSASLPLQRKAAEIWVREECPANDELGNVPKRKRGKKIRIGYFSMDFRNHAVSVLTAELFETHDRDRFEIYAFSFGPDTKDEMRIRLEAAFDRFMDVRDKSDREIVELARQMGIDIAVDLAGFTTDSRTGIFAFRVATLQVNYLGYPGTMGAGYIDYMIADKTLVPKAVSYT